MFCSSTYLPYVGAGSAEAFLCTKPYFFHLISSMGGFHAHYAIQEGNYSELLFSPNGHSDQIHAKFFFSLHYYIGRDISKGVGFCPLPACSQIHNVYATHHDFPPFFVIKTNK